MDQRSMDEFIKKFNDKVRSMTPEEKEYVYDCLGIEDEKTDREINTVQTFIELAEQDKSIVDKYGNSIDMYYRLPNKSRKLVCGLAYRYFIDTGRMDISLICDLINTELSNLENKDDPVVTAIRESVKLREKLPKINVDGVRYE
jgi:hypothetical protein